MFNKDTAVAVMYNNNKDMAVVVDMEVELAIKSKTSSKVAITDDLMILCFTFF